MSLRLFVFRVPISSLFLARNKFAHRASISTFLWSKSKNSCFVLGKKSIAVSSRNMSSGDKRKSSGSAAGESPSKKAKVENGAASSSQDGATGSEDFLQQIADRRTGVCESVAGFKFNKKRCRQMSDGGDLKQNCGGILYWMSRDQRVQDNWALLFAQRLAIKHQVPLYVCFCLVPKFLDATIRHYGFMLKGLEEVEKELTELDVSFHLLTGHAVDVLPEFVSEKNIGGVVTDFSPLRTPMKWVHDLAGKLPSDVPFVQVDAHNIVPCWEASPKQEYGARTIRNKIHNQLSSYLTEFPPVCKHPHPPKDKPEPTDWAAARASLQVDMTVAEVTWATPGTTGGLRQLESFCKQRLKNFGTDRNNPNKRALSNLSPWIHFGQISVQRCILTVKKYRSKYKESVDAYIEEAIIRRELSDNFCFYNHDKYDSIKGAAAWAQKTLKDHAGDKREYLYSREQLEQAKTHDDLWNAAQIQLNKEGKMHGFLRMYWAKKILEWTESPQVALKEAIYLNDKYSLDGRDPNGYVGCMWSICGIHDQGWAERPVFGKIRFMNYNGCKRKFDVAQFVTKYKAKGFLKK